MATFPLVLSPFLTLAAMRRALDIAGGRAPREFSLYRTDKLEPLDEALAVLQVNSSTTPFILYDD